MTHLNSTYKDLFAVIRFSEKLGSSMKIYFSFMAKTLENHNKSATFNEFVSDALTQDNQYNIYAASKNRKRAFEVGAS